MKNKKPKILIIDNEYEICNLFKDFFDFMGYDSAYETDGKKALDELESLTYDVLFVDLKLDNLSGIEILKKSKDIHPLSEVIVVTGYGSDETVLSTLNSGALSYIQKPISFSEIKIQTEIALSKCLFNEKTNEIANLLAKKQQPVLFDHFKNIINFDKFSTFLNLSIDIETLADSILTGISEIIVSKYYSFLFLDEVNREIVIFSRDPIKRSVLSVIDKDIAAFFEGLLNKKLETSYNIRASLSSSIQEDGKESISPMLTSLFVPLLVENTIQGVLGLSNIDEPLPDDALDLLRLVSVRASNVLNNATLHRDTKLLALTDGLTGLLNHRAFHERLISEFERYRRYGSFISLIIADFDYLKDINDTYGHPVGDEILRKIGDILRETSRESDVLARYGGDEFVILLPQTNLKNACNMAERIRKKVYTNTFSIQGQNLKSTLTMGVSAVPQEDIDSPEDLFESADRALYEAKRSGKNRVFVAGQMN
ncbi:diguanylate cyclase [bacterium]|nr:diguanylate cyclase [bacterium]